LDNFKSGTRKNLHHGRAQNKNVANVRNVISAATYHIVKHLGIAA
jgi:hypothetical protein